MEKFSNNSCPNIIVFSNAPFKIIHKDNIDGVMDFTFSTIQINNINILNEYIVKYKKFIDLIVVQCDNTYTEKDKLYKYFESLPKYYKRRILVYNDWQNHAKDLYNIINRQIDSICNPFISFITPLYKTNKKYFYDLYSSLKRQTVNDWEWIIVDDSPYGEELEFAKETASYDMRVFYYRIEPTNGNIGLAKWRANCMSSGNWLMELDHDDIILPYTIDFIQDASKQYKDAGFIYSSTANLDDNGEFIDKIYGDYFAYMYGVNDTVWDSTYNKDIPFISTPINECTIMDIISAPNHLRCWRRDIYFEIGGHSQYIRACDDYELIVRTFLKTRFINIYYPLYIQRFAGQNSQYESDNIIDINNRKIYIRNHYYNKLKERFKQEYNIEIFGNSPEETIKYYCVNIDKSHNVNYIY